MKTYPDAESAIIYFEDEKAYRHIECPERFAWILEEKLGREAADYFKRFMSGDAFDFDELDCEGECDKVYETQEHYEHVIHDAIANLKCITDDTTPKRKIADIIYKIKIVIEQLEKES